MTAAAIPAAPLHVWSRRDTGAAFALATVLGLVSAIQTAALQSLERQVAPAWALLVFSLAGWWCWAAAAPAIFILARRWPFRPRWWASLPVHLGAAIGLSTLFAVLLAVLVQVIPLGSAVPRSLAETIVGLAVSRLQGNLLIYGAIATIAWALRLRQEMQAQALRAASLEGALAHAELAALRMQLDPHFLFNTLHAIRTLIDDDPASARRMLVRLGDLLHATLGEGRAQEIALRDELVLLRGYLEIEAMRFADRMTVQIEVADELLDHRVPSFVLQPLAENAVRHGIARRVDGGCIRVSAQVHGRHLHLVVRNTAAPADAAPVPGHGIGLAAVRARLQRLYGSTSDVALALDQAEMVATLAMPLQDAT